MHTDPAPQGPKHPVDDLVGPGRTEQILKPAPAPAGTRISGRAKRLVWGGAALIAGAAIGGVLLAGPSQGTRSRAGRAAQAPAEQVGQVPPPVPPPPLAAMAPGDAAGPSSGVPPASLERSGSGSVDLLASGRLSGASPQQALQYQTWRVRQRYKAIEKQVLAGQAALSAPIAQGGPVGSAETASGDAFGVPPLPVTPDALAGAPESRQVRGSSANQRFLEAERHRQARAGLLAETLQKPASAHEVFAGSVLPAVLLTGIDSDLPGEVVAQVRQNVDNSLDPAEVLIPQGARLIGVYRSGVAYGQRRVLIAWRRIIFPNGSTVALQGMPGTDALGRAGFQDQVDNHYGRIFGSAFLVSLLGAGAQLAQPQNGGLLNTPSAEQQAAANLANEMNHVGAHLLNKNLGIQPTLRIRPGYLFDVLVTQTMVLPPYSHE